VELMAIASSREHRKEIPMVRKIVRISHCMTAVYAPAVFYEQKLTLLRGR
jgi:hypothetical protein